MAKKKTQSVATTEADPVAIDATEETYTEYIVKTPNPDYSGKVLGVTFSKGRALVSKHTIDEGLGWSVKELADMFKRDYAYTVEPAR